MTDAFGEAESERAKVRAQIAGHLCPVLGRRAVGGRGITENTRYGHRIIWSAPATTALWILLRIQSGVALRLPLRSKLYAILRRKVCNLAHHELANFFVRAHVIFFRDEL